MHGPGLAMANVEAGSQWWGLPLIFESDDRDAAGVQWDPWLYFMK